MLRRHFLGTMPALAISLPRTVRLGVIGTGNRGTSLLETAVLIDGVSVAAVADVKPEAAAKALAALEKRKMARPKLFANGPEAWRQLLDAGDVDAVLIASPEPLHAPMAVEALRAGKAVLSEVAAATTLEDCWKLVDTVEQTRGFYMLAENCCFYRSNLAVGAMVRAGLFGEITSADCAYIHSVPGLGFTPSGELTWRGQLSRDTANWYPTHSVGPVAQWLGIERGDRFTRIHTLASPSRALPDFAREKFPATAAANRTRYFGDTIVSLMETAQGKLIELKLDTASRRPTISTTHYFLQGVKGAYRDSEGQKSIYLAGAEEKWQDFAAYEARHADRLWKEHGAEAAQSGHGGADLITLFAFFSAVAEKRPSPIDVYDAVAWSSIIPLSTMGVKAKGAAQEFPDFSRGKWQERR